jgi:cysteine-rich repeat protein
VLARYQRTAFRCYAAPVARTRLLLGLVIVGFACKSSAISISGDAGRALGAGGDAGGNDIGPPGQDGHVVCYPTCGTWVSTCGDGVVTSDEVCDDGNTVRGDGCAADCQSIEAGWQCRVPGKACIPVCPDGKRIGPVCPPPTCVQAARDAGGPCAVCGDGVVSGDEECDDGNDPSRNPHDDVYGGCTTTCTFGPYCGDGIVNGPEECDDGPANGVQYGGSGCTYACTKPHRCGDGIVDRAFGEQCDVGADNGGINQPCDLECRFILLLGL